MEATSMASNYEVGTEVEWNWGDGTATGKIVEVHMSDVCKMLKGTEVKRNASNDDPAYLIEQSDGDEVLKSQSELRKS
jgi:hypothetical protein